MSQLIIIDGLTFQLQARQKGGISRIWKNIIPLLMEQMPDVRFLLLKRGDNDPGIPGLQSITVPLYSYATFRLMDRDADLLSNICHEEGANLFVSTYYSIAPGIRAVQMVYDMIPEVYNANAETGMWRSKKVAFHAAGSFISISESTRYDLKRFYGIAEDGVTIAYPGVSPEFFPASQAEIEAFKLKYDVTKPFFFMVGNRKSYKNAVPAYNGFLLSGLKGPYRILTAGGDSPDEQERTLGGSDIVHVGQLTDSELRAAFSCSAALIYPSRYEGFGMPVSEALACGCPVITCNNSSLPEASGGHCLYANPDSPDDFAAAMRRIVDPSVRENFTTPGMSFVGRFTWRAMADSVAGHLTRELCGPAKSCTPAVDRRSQARKLVLSGMEQDTAARPEKAAEYYKAAQTADPGYFLPCLALGLAAEKRGALNEAATLLNQAAALDPDNRTTVLAEARVTARQGCAEQSLPLLYRYFDMHPVDPDLLSALRTAEEGWCKATLARAQQSDHGYIDRPYRITALVSSYNAGPFMAECLGSLEAQTCAGDVEIIVVDAHSPGNEGGVVEDFQKKHDNIRYVRTEQRISVYAAWNLAISISKGMYLTPFSTNDSLRPEAYALLGRVLDTNHETALVYGDSNLTDLPHQSFESYKPSSVANGTLRWPAFDYHDLLFKCLIGPHPLWRRSLHAEFGYFDSRSTAAADQDFWLRIGRTHKLMHLSEITGLICLSPDSLSLRPEACVEVFEIHMRHLEDYLAAVHGEIGGSTLNLLLNHFLETVTRLVECGDNRRALDFFPRHRPLFATTRDLGSFDSLMAKMKSKTGR